MDARRRTVGRSALIAALSMVAMLGLTFPASASQPLVATDVAAQAGVAQSTQTWSAPVFIELQKGSAGFQIGAEQIDCAQ